MKGVKTSQADGGRLEAKRNAERGYDTPTQSFCFSLSLSQIYCMHTRESFFAEYKVYKRLFGFKVHF